MLCDDLIPPLAERESGIKSAVFCVSWKGVIIFVAFHSLKAGFKPIRGRFYTGARTYQSNFCSRWMPIWHIERPRAKKRDAHAGADMLTRPSKKQGRFF